MPDSCTATPGSAATCAVWRYTLLVQIRFVVVHGQPGARLVDCVVHPHALLASAGRLRLHGHYYILKQLLPALDRLFSLLAVDVYSWFNNMPKPQRLLPHKRPLASLPLGVIPCPLLPCTKSWQAASPMFLICCACFPEVTPNTQKHLWTCRVPLVPSTSLFLSFVCMPCCTCFCEEGHHVFHGCHRVPRATAVQDMWHAGDSRAAVAAASLSMTTIDQFYASRHCIVCDDMTPAKEPICQMCARAPQLTTAVLMVRLHLLPVYP